RVAYSVGPLPSPAPVPAQKNLGRGAVTHRYALLGGGPVFRVDETCAAAIGIDDDAAEELEFALVVVGLAAVVREESYPAAHQPMHRVGAVLHQRFCKIGIDVVLCDTAEVVEVVFGRIFAEV